MNIHDIDYIDVHCHLDLYEDYKQIIREIEQHKTLVIAVTNTPSIFKQEEQLFKSDNVILALGLHPQLIKEYGNQIDLFFDLFPRTKFIGEIGLDYQNTNIDIRKRQQEIFKRIIEESAKYKNKILSVHSRRSSEDVISLIGPNFPGKIILHWYSGSISTLKKALSNGYFFSINSSMINSKNGQSIVKLLPLERILTETDGPFISLNDKIVIPTDVEVTINYLAQVFGKTKDEIREKLKMNFLKVIAE